MSTLRSTRRSWHDLDLLAQSQAGVVSYFQCDGLGSVRQLADGVGDVQLAQTFDPYGNGYTVAGTA